MFISTYFLYMKKKTSWILIKISWLLKCSNYYHKHWPWFREVFKYMQVCFFQSRGLSWVLVCVHKHSSQFQVLSWSYRWKKILSPHARKPKVRTAGSVTIHSFCSPILQLLREYKTQIFSYYAKLHVLLTIVLTPLEAGGWSLFPCCCRGFSFLLCECVLGCYCRVVISGCLASCVSFLVLVRRSIWSETQRAICELN